MEFLRASNKHKQEEQTEAEKIKSERDMMKQQLSGLYNTLGFTEIDKNLLFKIIDDAQDKIEKLKNNLIETNTEDDHKITEKAFLEIEKATNQMIVDLKAKTDELRARKK